MPPLASPVPAERFNARTTVISSGGNGPLRRARGVQDTTGLGVAGLPLGVTGVTVTLGLGAPGIGKQAPTGVVVVVAAATGASVPPSERVGVERDSCEGGTLMMTCPSASAMTPVATPSTLAGSLLVRPICSGASSRFPGSEETTGSCPFPARSCARFARVSAAAVVGAGAEVSAAEAAALLSASLPCVVGVWG